ncbi:MAG TPA: YdaU family protein [Nevskia sp.]|nr:YdaU family protein [Nevskia sp.]
MNYYEHHIGDYLKDAAFLTMVQDGAYRRLLDAYYTREKPLPADVKECCKLARAQTKPERDAVAYVLREFFNLEQDGHHQKRCEEEIAVFLEGQEGRQTERANAAERQRRARERRAQLFQELRDRGVTAPYNAKTSDLEALLSQHASQPVTRDVTATPSHPVTRDNTATQTPVPSTQYPEHQKLTGPTGLVPATAGDHPGQQTITSLETKREAATRRLATVTEEAVETYNAQPFTKRNGGNCPNVELVNDVRRRQVKRCVETASQISAQVYGTKLVERRFWVDYWAAVNADEFHSGRGKPGEDHAGWTPDFEFLTRADVMTRLFDRAMSESAA